MTRFGITSLTCLAAATACLGMVSEARAEHGLFGARSITVEASLHTLGLVQDDPEMGARHTYAVLASLPTPESTVRTYDVRPVVNFVFGQTVQLSQTIVVKFARGRNLVQANLGPGQTLGVVPNGFGLAQGGILSFISVF